MTHYTRRTYMGQEITGCIPMPTYGIGMPRYPDLREKAIG
jgi:hypothetical protein